MARHAGSRSLLTIFASSALFNNMINGFTLIPHQQHGVTLGKRARFAMVPTSSISIKPASMGTRQQQHYMLPPSSALETLTTTTTPATFADSIPSSILTAVETFDGNAIVDPVVVSNVFWTSLKTKVIALIIGQMLATIAFALLSTLVATQISQMGDFVSQKIFQQPKNQERTSSTKSNRDFVKANTSQYEKYQQNASQRPTPAIDADFGKLLICIAVDIIGSSSEVIPILGELTDVVYAPIAATILRSLYGGSNVIFALEFAEEILPFTDILPLATIW